MNHDPRCPVEPRCICAQLSQVFRDAEVARRREIEKRSDRLG